MNLISLVLLYAFSCSTVLVYGIGLEKANQDSRSPKLLLARIPALLIQLLVAVPVSRSLAEFFLVPNGFASLIPMAVIFTCALTILALSAVIPVPSNAETGERLFFFGTVFLSISEGMTFLSSLTIAFSSLAAFILVSLLLVAVRERFSSSHISDDWKGIPIILVSLGLLFIVLNSADALWWLQGGTR